MALGYESGDKVGSVQGKNRGKKSRKTVPCAINHILSIIRYTVDHMLLLLRLGILLITSY
jgi:hypothetical protein